MGFHLELIYLTPSHAAVCLRYLRESPCWSSCGCLNLKFCSLSQQPGRLYCWERDVQRGDGHICMIDVEHRDSSNNSGARSSIVASVPRYTRMTIPPRKKTLSLRDAMPPDLSEHFCVGPCCTALQPSGAWQVRATGVWVL